MASQDFQFNGTHFWSLSSSPTPLVAVFWSLRLSYQSCLVPSHLLSLSISEVGVMSKTTTLQVHHAFLYSSLPSLHNYDVKTPDRKLNGGRKQGMTNFYFLLLKLSAVPK